MNASVHSRCATSHDVETMTGLAPARVSAGSRGFMRKKGRTSGKRVSSSAARPSARLPNRLCVASMRSLPRALASLSGRREARKVVDVAEVRREMTVRRGEKAAPETHAAEHRRILLVEPYGQR